jgi:hypothetical protein
MDNVWMLFSVDGELGCEDALYAFSSPEPWLRTIDSVELNVDDMLLAVVQPERMHGVTWHYRPSVEDAANLAQTLGIESARTVRPRSMYRVYLWDIIEERHTELTLRQFTVNEHLAVQ